jgi:ribosome production factor 2
VGRLYNEKILDMVEFGVSDHQAMAHCEKIEYHSKPVLIFQGDFFDFNDNLKQIKNLFIDFFSTQQYKEINIQEMNRVIVFTALTAT